MNDRVAFEQALNRRLRARDHCAEARSAMQANDGRRLCASIEQLGDASLEADEVQRLFAELCAAGRFLSATLLLATAEHGHRREHARALYAALKQHIDRNGGAVALDGSDSSDDSSSDDDDDDETSSSDSQSIVVVPQQQRSPVASTPAERYMLKMRQFIAETFTIDRSLAYDDGVALESVPARYEEWARDRPDMQLAKTTLKRCLTAVVREQRLVIDSSAAKKRHLALAERADRSDGVRVVREPTMERALQQPMSEAEMLRRDTGDYQYDGFVDDEIIFEEDADSDDVERAFDAVRSTHGMAASSKKRRRLRRRGSNSFIDEEAVVSDAE